MDMSQYLDVFIDESKEHLQMCNEQLLRLEENPEDLEIVNIIFRSAHTLKGMAATMGYQDLTSLTHEMENVLDLIRNKECTVNSYILDTVFEAVDYLEVIINSIVANGDGKKDVQQIVEKLKRVGTKQFQLDDKEEKNHSDIGRKMSITNQYDEFELSVIQQSIEQGYNSLLIEVTLREDCLLKAVRVFMIFEALEQVGEVVKSTPSVGDLETEQFDQRVTLTILTKHDPEQIKQIVLNISEIEQVDINELVIDTKKIIDVDTHLVNKEVAATLEIEEEKNATKEPVSPHSKTGNKTIRVNLERLDLLMNLFEELVIDRGRLEQISSELKHPQLEETVERITRTSGNLQNIILNIRMVPIENVFNRFPRMVRQLAKDLNKKVILEVIGAETELDRTVIDEIGDPLVHLLRNAIDHGIEMPEQRIIDGKNDEGRIILKAYHSGNRIFIEIQDDGAGINRDKVIDKAIRQGIIGEEDKDVLTDMEVFNLLFSSGFSTAEKISDISGRGVGLDVVKNKIEALGGSITIHSTLGQGSTFVIELPLTLSIMSALFVEVGTERYGIPLSAIVETAIISEDDILQVHNRKVIDFRDKIVPIIYLREIFEVKNSENTLSDIHVVIIKKGDNSVALVVDAFIGQQEIVIKPLSDYLSSVFAISGATILGDGQVALIIDSNALIK